MAPNFSVPGRAHRGRGRLAGCHMRRYAARMRTLLGLALALSVTGCKSTDTKQDTTTANKAEQPGSGALRREVLAAPAPALTETFA